MDITFKNCLPSDFNFSIENSKLSKNEITNRTPSKRRRNEENSPCNRTPKRRLNRDETATPRKTRAWTVFTDRSPSSNIKSQKLSVQRPLCENSRSNGASSTDISSSVSGVQNTPTKSCKNLINSYPSHELYGNENSLSNCTPMKSSVLGNSPSKRTPKHCVNSDTGRLETTPRTISLRPVFKEISPNSDTCKSTDRSLFDRLNEVGCENSGVSVSELTHPGAQYSNPDEPITPTTNFKLLSSLAARCSYINNPSVEKHLNRRLLLQDEDVPTTTCMSSISADSSETSCKTLLEQRREEDSAINLSAIKKDKVERKEKSLGLLCERFMDMFVEFPMEEQCVTINLCAVALELGVEKRRMYDVINILESMKIVSRVCKNKYKWLGKNNLLEVLKELKGQATLLKTSRGSLANKLYDVLTMSHSAERESADLKICSSQECRKDNSLAIICRNFLMLFLISPDTPLTLDMAAKVLEVGAADNNPAKLKTRVRRLYDISNVLQALGLLQKTIINEARGRKTAFLYVGPDVLGSEESENVERNNFPRSDNSVQCTSSSIRNSMNRHPSLDAVCQVASLEMQKLIMEQVEPLDFSSESHSNHRIELSNTCSNDTENLRNSVPGQNVVEIIQTKDACGLSIQNLHSKAPETANPQTVVISKAQFDALLKAANISLMNNLEHVQNMKNQAGLCSTLTKPLAKEKVNSDGSVLEVNEVEYISMANSNGTLRKPLETHNITNLITRNEVEFYNPYDDSENSTHDQQSTFQCQSLLTDTRRSVSDGFNSMHASINDKKTGSLPLGGHSRENVTLAATISSNKDIVHFPPSSNSIVEHCIQETVPNSPNLRLRLIESFESYTTPEKFLSTPYVNVHAPHDQNQISSSSKSVANHQLSKHWARSNVPKMLSFTNGISPNSFMNRSNRAVVNEHPSKKDVARKLNMFN